MFKLKQDQNIMEITVSNNQSIQQLPVLKLMPLLKLGQDETTRRKAETRFYDIFKEEIWTFCKIVIQNKFGHVREWEEIAQEIHSDAFRVALSKIHEFILEDGCSEAKAYNTVRRYISRTANFLILKHIAQEAKNKKDLDGYKEFVELELDEGEEGFRETIKSYDSKKFNQLWAGLKPLAKEIILLCYEHGCFPTAEVKNKKHLPDEVLEYLCAKYDNTDRDNIRQIKSRTFKKIIECKIT